MKAKMQGVDEIVVNTDPEQIWSLLEDGTRLYEWMKVVKHTDSKKEAVGLCRECNVRFDGREGIVRERCIEADRPRYIAWELVDDTLGFSKLFNDFAFSFSLKKIADGKTLIRNETYYETKNLVGSFLNVFVFKRKFHEVRMTALKGLKRLSENNSTSAERGHT